MAYTVVRSEWVNNLPTHLDLTTCTAPQTPALSLRIPNIFLTVIVIGGTLLKQSQKFTTKKKMKSKEIKNTYLCLFIFVNFCPR